MYPPLDSGIYCTPTLKQLEIQISVHLAGVVNLVLIFHVICGLYCARKIFVP